MKYATFNEDGSLRHRLIDKIHEIPGSAVPVDDTLWCRLIQEDDGLWMLTDGVIAKHPLVEPTLNLTVQERAWRDSKLLEAAWLRDRHRDQVEIGVETALTAERFSELLVYMQQLRDWPQNEAFPASDHRPTPPSWIIEHNQ